MVLFDILAHHAKWSNDKAALLARDGEPFSYSRTLAIISALATALRDDFPALLGRNAPVAIALADRRLHFLMTLALEYLGITCLPFVMPPDPGVLDGLQTCSTLICDQKVSAFTKDQILLDSAWAQARRASRTRCEARSGTLSGS